MQERARAIIIRDGLIVLVKRGKPSETYCVFPGGAVEKGETPEAAVVREVKEETGLEIEVKKFLKKEIWDSSQGQQMEYFYSCDEIGGKIGSGNGPEYQQDSGYEGTYEVMRVALARLPNLDCRPASIKDLVIEKFGNS
jgi:8-oxo-dGTP diphosphatase